MISNAAKLSQYQLWRIGADDRTLDEIGLTPKNISEAIDGVLKELNTLRQQNAELVELNKQFAELAKRQGWQHALINEYFKLCEEIKGDKDA